MSFDVIDTKIPILGKAKIPSPIRRIFKGEVSHNFVSDSSRIVIETSLNKLKDMISQGKEFLSFEEAGPRSTLYFDPSKLRCALVTCGGLCPGLNDIIRSIVLELYHGYGVRRIYGIKYGLRGFIPEYGHDIVELNPECVANILEMGGTILGSSRGPQPIEEITDSLERMNIGILFMIGGDGTLMAATKIADSITARSLKISVVGIPKTIDNDIYMVSRSFGFDTAVEEATRAVKGAHNEAEGYPNGIGLIKLMGRHSGFIAATTTLAQQDVNFVLIPEADFDLEGRNGLLHALEKRLELRGHAVIVVAEGAGQKFFQKKETGHEAAHDESGNIKLKDIGLFLKEKILSYFKDKNITIALKYIDPSYMIRSLPANANDHAFCSFLGRNAVHAGMAGKTRLLIGRWNNLFVNLPMSASVGKRKQIDPTGRFWLRILETTGQPSLINEQIN